jgi:hypothetical protein
MGLSLAYQERKECQVLDRKAMKGRWIATFFMRSFLAEAGQLLAGTHTRAV